MTNYRRKTIDDFVHDEVLVCASGLVSDIIKLRNQTSTDSETLNEFYYDYWLQTDHLNDEVEIFEWWIVTNWMADKLKAQNECIIEAGFVSIWGRTCTGQSVTMDSVIEDIYNDLFGDDRSWEDNAPDGRKWGN